MLIFVTNRKLCQEDFLQRIEKLAKTKPLAIMLREKDMNSREYQALALQASEICSVHGVPLIINQNVTVAAKLKLPYIHLSMPDLRKNQGELERFEQIGASVHSVAEAVEAEQLGASYVIAGHIFETDCKKGIPPRGLPFLKEICQSVAIPVFAIGGVTKDKLKDIGLAGAKGACIMSEAMVGNLDHYKEISLLP